VVAAEFSEVSRSKDTADQTNSIPSSVDTYGLFGGPTGK
jgi:hypothetical protein